ncbi:unnamed protein product [Allacma fusca]|uniref:Fatty acid synthase n=1 Tax=Allacma fusca TaxID=39272 RepID=A0A8J2L0W2_9HEXA|nr:unnamed protein product [Allacma fusca]
MDAHRDWVISGMSGRFPGSENLDDFWDQLIQGKDTVSESNRSWDSNGYEVPTRMGSIPFLEKFDASFFGVSGTQANGMDPKIRIALEVVYEAIADAGLNPKTLDGDRVGVFMATSYSEASDIWLRSSEKPSAHCITGSHPTMLADRISYTFNFRGPSCFLDSGCSGSFNAMQYAMLALKNGLCDSAIVGGATIDLLPLLAQVYYSVNVLSADGKCKAFDADCDGYARSEAVVALYICRKDRARRSYATIVGVKCVNDGYKPESISAPSAEKQEQLMKELYAEAKINPLEVAYVEAHGTGTKVGDPKEIASLAAVFCNGRKEPLLVGSVKTNIGHTEAVSGICGIMKMLMSRRAGTIPPNLHFKNPNPECRALIDGRVRVVTDTTSFKGNIVGVNSFGIGGTSAHVILQFDDINSLPVIDCDSGNIVISSEAGKWETEKRFSAVVLPTLILASGRTKEAVEHFLNVALKNSNNMEFVGLLHNIARTNVPRHDFAGYALTKSNENFEIVNQKRLDSRNSICLIWDVPNHKNEISSNNGTKISISLLSDESLSGHVIQGKIIFPAAGYIRLVWKAFAKLQSVNPDDLPIHLENINFTQIRELLPNRDLEFKVSILKESGHFEIVEENEVVCTGIIQRANKTQQESLTRASIANSNGETLEQEDFYKLLNLKGYHYEGLFQGVRNIDVEGRWAKLLWKQNWTCFLDAMLQTRILDFDASRQHVLATHCHSKSLQTLGCNKLSWDTAERPKAVNNSVV